MSPKRILILGAAGRDFHNFNTLYRDDPTTTVVAFTATQIPNIAGRRYPPELAGPLYPGGIAIEDEDQMERLIRDQGIDEAVFAYSDVSLEHVGRLGSRALAAGARFALLPPRSTSLAAAKPVVSVCAVRTGSGKSQTSRFVAQHLRGRGLRVGALRHPMPYGDLTKQVVQAFHSYADLDAAECTIEEREEYEPYLELGMSIYAGVDYQRILALATQECDVLLWDGGNNDTPFLRSDLQIVVLDPLRAGHETRYYPGLVNLIAADVLVVNKVDQATAEQVAAVEDTARQWNPRARLVRARSPIEVSDPELVRGRRVLCIEDGPTTTHGGMAIGAAWVAAKSLGCTIVDPRPVAVGSIARAFQEYPHLGEILPALGYFPAQLEDLRATIERADVDAVLVGTPIDLRRLIAFPHPAVRVTYRLAEVDSGSPTLTQLLDQWADAQKL